ncbi:hypothetical protein NEUTE1DRAFT_144836 [Neurospora tetrasperma FGSC 2508]|uniref:Uncharacterized protein n=1 Tax=Neurospora tetrasperma (strain FGSC 2508 / ATCC MYA-4615 / P0657) TaxID=510951 RepID=F8MGA5_NEUT8|nr:uncharacterized protein NEUTE1DRAFT_144836 [Neurospora tetrasperma FGSC 2508]EGO58580.1 hypothetical protein NEUTE1DRAFT_144836 [Neurospora tetrasperma FGSC 2508]EGZ72649.1 hypothetical protein NEUTE2DRAFT_149010 [Neurospora tetrasperma FGSC 2509]
MPNLKIPPLLSPIPSSVLLRYATIYESNTDTDNPSEEPEIPGHTHRALPPFLRGIPIDWSQGYFTWQRKGCDCVVKFCPQHCRELIGSRDDESKQSSMPASDLQVDASDPYNDISSNDYYLDSNNEAVDDSDEHDVDDDDHNSEVDNDDADDEAGSGSSSEAADDDGNDMQSASGNQAHNASVLPSIEGGHQSGEGSPTPSVSPGEGTALDDPNNLHEVEEGTVSLSDRNQPDDIMDDSNETEVPNPELPQPQPQGSQVQRMQRPAHQPPPPAELGFDTEYLEALPEELRNEVIADTQAKDTGTQRSQPQPQARGREREQVFQRHGGESSGNAEVLQEFLGVLPEDLRNEILPPLQAWARAQVSALPPLSSLPVMSAITTTTNRPAYQTSRQVAQEAGPRSQYASPRAQQHHQRRRSDFLARVLNSIPSPAPGSTGTPGDGVDSVSSRTQAQPNQSQTLMPTGLFSTSTPKPVARKLFARSDAFQPRSAPVKPANDMDLEEANGMVTRSQSRRRGRADTVDEVGEASKVGESIGMVTRSQGRRRSQARNGVEVQDNQDNRDKEEQEQEQEQDIQGEEASRRNKRRKKTEEDRESEGKEKKKKTLGRAKRGKPKGSGNTKTYAKRDKRRRV